MRPARRSSTRTFISFHAERAMLPIDDSGAAGTSSSAMRLRLARVPNLN
jgi:hypothetical protein